MMTLLFELSPLDVASRLGLAIAAMLRVAAGFTSLLPERIAWETAVARMRSAGFDPIAAFNPWWDRLGATFEDPDGYRVVLQNARWIDATPGER